ncbi:MAG: 5'/3'-nucleotidase SurE [Chitinivibrionales bacterium]
MTKRLRILLTNDDGYQSAGIKRMHEALVSRHEVIVAAPRNEQSGIGHAFTFNRPLNFARLPEEACMDGYMVSGTPSDCVKFAISYLLKEKPDIIVSGVNSGENSGISGFYSGTLAAAREGAFWGIPSFAFSLCVGGEGFLIDYSRKALDIMDLVMAAASPSVDNNQTYYNVNFPSCSPELCKGIKVTRQSLAFFDDRYELIKVENAQDGYMVYGEKKEIEGSDLYDSRALMNQYITITPLHFDATAHWQLRPLSSLER